MEVKVLSRETIMPSSPTSPHLGTFQLSLLDQLSPMLYIPLLFFYPINDKDHLDQKKKIAKLKSSLSETLSHFYLLAGRIVDTSIRCSDEGAIFIEASVCCNMFEILIEPNNEVLMKLLPRSIVCTEQVEECAQIVVQANIFNCGGIAISLCLLHKLMDGATFGYFLKSWASVNKGSFASSPKMVCSDYRTFSSLFPQTNLLPFHPRVHEDTSQNPKRKRCLRRFVFGAKEISDLKAKAKSNNVTNPTCVEALTGFIWKYAMEAASVSYDSRRLSTLTHVVNLRKRMNPPLPEFSVGNIIWAMVAHYSTNDELEVELSELVSLLRQSFTGINSDYIRGLMGDEGSRSVSKLLGEINKASKYYFCTSWRNLGLNEVDFGWGKPLWIGIAGNPNVITNDSIILLDTVSGDGVEAWMVLDEKEMELLEHSREFLEFALLNPSVHQP